MITKLVLVTFEINGIQKTVLLEMIEEDGKKYVAHPVRGEHENDEMLELDENRLVVLEKDGSRWSYSGILWRYRSVK